MKGFFLLSIIFLLYLIRIWNISCFQEVVSIFVYCDMGQDFLDSILPSFMDINNIIYNFRNIMKDKVLFSNKHIWEEMNIEYAIYVHIRFRVLYDNVISLLYDTYTSHVKNDIPLQEDFEENLVKSGKSELIGILK